MRDHPYLMRMIPVTSLRHLYRFLSEHTGRDFQLRVAQEINHNVNPLDRIVETSVAHFAFYDNHEEAFHDDRNFMYPHQNPAYYQSPLPAYQLYARISALGQNAATVHEHPDLAFHYVDYEIAPCRTTGEVTSEDGTYGPGGDTLDLLLANSQDRHPIVGEVKAPTDGNPFSGLIQGLNYVVTLSSVPQRARLAQSYPDRFQWPAAGPVTDLYVILINYPQGNVHQEFLQVTSNIAQQLLQPQRAVAHIIRRIVCLNTNLDPLEFTILFAHPG